MKSYLKPTFLIDNHRYYQKIHEKLRLAKDLNIFNYQSNAPNVSIGILHLHEFHTIQKTKNILNIVPNFSLPGSISFVLYLLCIIIMNVCKDDKVICRYSSLVFLHTTRLDIVIMNTNISAYLEAQENTIWFVKHARHK